jgi:protein-S-isoprenylcysteine O-methyltransferase Ste14
MERKQSLFVAIVLSALFTIALVYATFEIPKLINSLLVHVFPDYALIGEWGKVQEVTEVMRPFGYVAFLCVLGLMLVGFIINRWKLSILGSFSLFLPVFGKFAFTMFFLAGVGFLRILWFPLIDASPTILKLGNAVYMPYLILEFLFHFINIDIGIPFSILSMSIGIFIFFLGVITWLHGKSNGIELIDFWIYKYSRHPQYLGFLIWSYGLLLLTSLLSVPRGGYVPPPSLIWLFLALVTIGSAIQEENAMTKKYGEKYSEYRNNTAFMIPLPKGASTLIMIPVKALLKKEWPESKKEVIYVIVVYGIMFIFLSLPFLQIPS